MINLRNSPFLWLALLLLLAFLTSEVKWTTPGRPMMIVLWATCVLSGGISILRFKPGKQIHSTMAIGVLILAAGIIRVTQFSTSLFPGAPLSRPEKMAGTVIVTEVLKEKEASVTLRCRQLNLHPVEDQDSSSFNDKFIVVQLKDPDTLPFFPGDKINVEGWLAAIKGPSNPHAFDVRTYYQSIGIRHQLVCKAGEYDLLPDPLHSLLRITSRWQSALCSVVSRHTTPDVAQLTNALVWGDRSDMNEEIRDAFADSGAMHVLSVSGMHMAIIYSMLFVVLGAPGAGSFVRRMLRLLFYTLAIVMYMGLTGACPAVVRSGLMILLYLLGKSMGWNTPIWNLLGFAAFVMLWINPFVWKNIGFQLSFLAMAGILLYAKPIIRCFTFRQTILHVTWEITAVSIVAQAFILPLLLQHFHQFPLTFIASSLVAMPASYVIIFGTLANVCLASFDIGWLWNLYDTLCRYFLLIMKWMAGLNPEMNYSMPASAGALLSCVAIFLSISLIYQWEAGKKAAYVLGAASILTLACHRSVQWHTDELIIYHQYQGFLADVFTSGQCIAIRDSSVNEKSTDFAARGHRCYRDVIQIKTLDKEESFISSQWSYSPLSCNFTNHPF